ncbi:MAG: CHAT domain-containing protein [Chloroflexaceae bacterium]|nr:CHAT domain-containing protein [Chloroflexaceae bacterium]
MQSFPASFTSPGETIQILTEAVSILPPIIAAEDGTGSQINTIDSFTFDITGGLLSADNLNLFHSFSRFDLPEAEQIANFIVATPGLENLLARVSSGDASEIRGTIQVTGGTPNLFLINPAGIVFGDTAQLNVPAAFTATTANGILFGGAWFSASGLFDPSLLNGTPSVLAFTVSQPGAIINGANLGIPGDLQLSGGTVVSTGQLNGDRLEIVSVNGQTLLNPDLTLSLSDPENLPNAFTGAIATLSELVTAGSGIPGITALDSNLLQIGSSVVGLGEIFLNGAIANTFAGLSVNTLTVNTLATSGTAIEGDIQLTADEINLIGGTSTISSPGQLQLQPLTPTLAIALGGLEESEGALNLTDSDLAALTDGFSEIIIGRPDSSGILTIGEASFSDPVTFQAPQGEIEVIGQLTGLDNASITIDGSGNTTTLSASIITDSQPITINDSVIVNGDVSIDTTLDDGDAGAAIAILGTVDGSSLGADQITLDAGNQNLTVNGAIGSNTALGSLEVNGNLAELNGGSVTTTNGQTFNSDIQVTASTTFTADSDSDGTGSFAADDIQSTGQAISVTANEIAIANINTSGETDNGGNVNLVANGNVTTQNIETGGNSIEITAGAIIATGDLDSSSDVSDGGAITLTTIGGDIATGNLNSGSSASGFFSGGEITLTSGGNIDVTNNPGSFILSGSIGGNGGNVTLEAAENIVTGTIVSASANAQGGDLTIISTGGSVNTTFLGTLPLGDLIGGEAPDISTGTGILLSGFGQGPGGAVQLEAAGNINTGTIFSGSLGTGDAGTIAVTSGGIINGTAISPLELGLGGMTLNVSGLDSSSTAGSSGQITLSGGTSIAIADINSSSIGGSGGDINLTAPAVTSGSINATGSLSSGNISVTANSVDFTGGTSSIVGQDAQLQLQSINPADDFAISSPDGVTSQAIAALGDGFSEIIIGRDDASGTLTVETAANFSDPVTFLVPSGTIIVDGQLTGTDNAAITITGSGATTTLNASIITDNTPVTIDGNVIIGSEVAIDTIGTDELGAAIIIGGEINGIEPGVGNLNLDAGSQAVTLGGAIGSNAALNSLEIDAASIFLSGNTVVTVNGQDFDGFLEVAGDTSFQANADGDENGTFNATTIQAPGHTITLSAASIIVETIDTSSLDSNGGNQILTATGNITASNLNASATGLSNGGNIELQSSSGQISLVDAVESTAIINTAAQDGNSGNVVLQAGDSIVTGDIFANSTNGNGGSLTLSATGNIVTGEVFSDGGNNGGAIALTSSEGSIDTSAGEVDSGGDLGNGGSITFTAAGDIIHPGGILSSFASNNGDGGAIFLNSISGNLSTTAGVILSSSTAGQGGSITLTAAGDIDTGSLVSGSVSGQGGNISLTSTGGDIDTTSSSFILAGTTETGIIFSGSFTGSTGGTVVLNAPGEITTGTIATGTYGSGGVAGNISLTSATAISAIATSPLSINETTQVSGLNASSLGTAGNITIDGAGQIEAAEIAGGQITLTGDEINLLGGPATVNGTNLTLQPATAARLLQIGAATNEDSNSLNLTAEDLEALADGFSQLLFGQADGILQVANPVQFNVPIVLRSQTITVDGAIVGSGDASVTLIGSGATTNLNANITTAEGDIFLQDSVLLGDSVTVTTDSGSIGIAGAIDGANSLILSANNGSIVLQGDIGTATPLSSLALTGNAIAIANVGGSNPGISGPLTATATAEIFFTGNTYNANEQTYSAGNSFNLAGGSTAFTSSGDNITFQGGPINLSLPGLSDLTITSNGGNIVTGDIQLVLSSPLDVETQRVSDELAQLAAGGPELTAFETSEGGAIRSGFDGNFLARNDDGSTGLVPIGFSVNFFGELFESLFVNNNGNITFDAPLSTFTPFPLTSTQQQIIAAFFADVDTRNPQSEVVTFGSGAVGDRQAFGVNYENVGYFSSNADLLNSFQIVLIERGDTGVSNFDIEFNYNQIQWETGDASGGVGGLGGSSARAGFSNGTGAPGTFFELPGSATNGGFLDSNPTTGLANNSLNSTQLGRYQFEVRNISIELPQPEVVLIGGTGSVTTGNIGASSSEQILSGVTISGGGINTGNIQAGTITLTSSASIVTENLDTSAIAGNGGNITASAVGNIQAGDINTSAINTGSGGNIEVTSQAGSLTTGAIATSSMTGNGGNVTLQAQEDIAVATINTQGSLASGQGGNVTIATEGLVRVSGTFIDQQGLNASISAAAETAGSVEISHGGQGTIPFTVGDATINGTAGAINTGSAQLLPQTAFPFTTIQGNISLLSITAPPPPDPIPDDPDPIPSDPGDFLSTPPKNLTILPVEPSSLTINSEQQAQAALLAIAQQTGVKPALIYVSFTPPEVNSDGDYARREAAVTGEYEEYLNLPTNQAPLSLSVPPADTDILELLLVTSKGETTLIRVPGATRREVLQEAARLYDEVSNLGDNYLPPAEKLYEWLIRPLREELVQQEVENLVFVMPLGLRLVPIAALYDAQTQEYVAQQYSSGFAPSLNLVDTTYRKIEELSILALGASSFEEDENQSPLPAVSIEVPLIATEIGQGEFFLDREFTLEQLRQARQANPRPIVHLATHADFQPGAIQDSYIQLYNQKITLEDFRQLSLNNPPVELLTISACRSAFGDYEAELGFGGLAAQIGVKTVMASLWYIGDTGTLALMNEFYRQLQDAPIKAEALRQAQLALLDGSVTKEGTQLNTTRGMLALPESTDTDAENLTHPFYWASFTIIGSPW